VSTTSSTDGSGELPAGHRTTRVVLGYAVPLGIYVAAAVSFFLASELSPVTPLLAFAALAVLIVLRRGEWSVFASISAVTLAVDLVLTSLWVAMGATWFEPLAVRLGTAGLSWLGALLFSQWAFTPAVLVAALIIDLLRSGVGVRSEQRHRADGER
jgi:hypothetical protein